MIHVDATDRIDRLGPEWDPLFEAGPGLQSRRAWFESTQRAALPEAAVPHIVTVRENGQPLAILPLQSSSPRMLLSLTSPYTTEFQPLLAPLQTPGLDAVRIGAALGRHLRRWPLVRLEALDPAWPLLAPLLAGFRQSGMTAQRFDHFGNWRENVAGLDWNAYLARRPGALRETIRRRGRTAAKDPSIRLEIVQGTDGLARAMNAYEAVYAQSWKEPEPYPHFNEVLLPRAASLGTLRLAVMWQGDTPLAAQYWTVVDRTATVLKLAHVDGAKALSPGTVLTAHVIRHLLQDETIETLDFGRGDDPYKKDWTTTRQQRIGVMLANPLRIHGLAEILRHWAGQARRTILSRRHHLGQG